MFQTQLKPRNVTAADINLSDKVHTMPTAVVVQQNSQ